MSPDDGAAGRAPRDGAGVDRPRRGAAGDGVLLIDKPAGVTSHDVVAGVRRRVGRGVKVGHAGTLDPFATGLLLVLVGRATRVQRFLMALPKAYETVARLGWTSTTGDVDGELAPGRTPPEPLRLPTGTFDQVPPQFSAVKVGGKRAYALARAGETVELAARSVTVTRFAELSRDGDRVRLAIECSSGTYVRSLVMDLADAYCETLRRTRIGAFDVADADEERLVGLGDALSFLPERRLDPDAASRAGHGVAVPDPGGPAAAHVRLTDADGLIAIGEPRDDGTVKPVVGFRG